MGYLNLCCRVSLPLYLSTLFLSSVHHKMLKTVSFYVAMTSSHSNLLTHNITFIQNCRHGLSVSCKVSYGYVLTYYACF